MSVFLNSIISRFFDIRKGELRLAVLMFLLHVVFMITLYVLKPTRDSLFLNHLGAEQLPFVYLLMAFVSVPVTHLLSTVMRRYSISKVVSKTLLTLIANLVLFRVLLSYDSGLIYLLFYVWVGIFGILIISLYWLLANAVYTVSASKRVFSFLTLGAIAGSIMGSQIASLLVEFNVVHTIQLVWVAVILLLTALGLVLLIKNSAQIQQEKWYDTDERHDANSALGVAKHVVRSKYQRTLAYIILLTMIATTFTDFQFKALATEANTTTDLLTAFLGNFYTGISVAALLIQLLLSSNIINRLGITGAVISRPVGMMAGAVLMLFEPVLASAVLLNGFDGATRYSIDKNGRELLFLPLSQERKEQSKIFIDIFVDRFGRGLAGLLLMFLLYWINAPIQIITLILTGVIVLWIILSLRAKRMYVSMFRQSLKNSLLDRNTMRINLDEPSILSTIRETISNNSPADQVLHVLKLLDEVQAKLVSDRLTQLLDHQHSSVRLRALKLLQSVDDLDINDKVKLLLEDSDPEIRIAAIYYLCQHSPQDPTQVIRSFLMGEDAQVRSAAFNCACRHSEDQNDQVIDEEIIKNMLNYEAADQIVVKAQVADALGFVKNRKVAEDFLPGLLMEEHPSIVKNALVSMGKVGADLFIPMMLPYLTDPKYSFITKKSLADFHHSYLNTYRDFFSDASINLDIRKKIPGIFNYVADPEKAKIQLQVMLEVQRSDLRYHVIKALNRLRRDHATLQFDSNALREIIRVEEQNFLEYLSIRQLLPDFSPNHILFKSLNEKMDETIERILGLFGMIYNQKDMYGTLLALKSRSKEKKSAAIEFLDNVLSVKDKTYLMPLIDERSDDERLTYGRKLFNLQKFTYQEGLLRLINGEDRWLSACSLYSVSPQCPTNLQNTVTKYLDSVDELLRETAQFVYERNSKPAVT